jgi:lincosamide nucleotidyltransferase A/C/D/E
MMNESSLIDLLENIETIGVSVWIGGGWGVDALMGFQTRSHNDVDVYIEKKNADIFIEMLILNGYREIKMEYTTEVHRVWQDSSNCVVDLHLIEFKEAETLYYDNEAYPSNVLNGKGLIGGISVRCFTAEAQVLFHQGYEHSEKDAQDVLLLCKTFGIDTPAEYKNSNGDNAV